jgi:hypothetical protein
MILGSCVEGVNIEADEGHFHVQKHCKWLTSYIYIYIYIYVLCKSKNNLIHTVIASDILPYSYNVLLFAVFTGLVPQEFIFITISAPAPVFINLTMSHSPYLLLSFVCTCHVFAPVKLSLCI